MSQDKTNQNLFEDFSPVSTEQWEEKIKIDLKGADYHRRLFWNSPEGIQVRPFYRSEDLEDIKYLDNKPDQFPYVRGNKKSNNDWLGSHRVFF